MKAVAISNIIERNWREECLDREAEIKALREAAAIMANALGDGRLANRCEKLRGQFVLEMAKENWS